MSAPALEPARRAHAAWLGTVERRVILPLKWLVLLFAIAHWVWARDGAAPTPPAFGLFVFFAAITAAEHYFFARDRVTPRQVRPFVFASFLLDAFFVFGAVCLDILEPPLAREPAATSTYFPLFIVLVLRGVALFRTRGENVLAFTLATALFLFAVLLQLGETGPVEQPQALRTLGVVWAIMLLGQAFVSLLNTQKEDELRTHERLVRSAGLASLGELSAGVAHEINNPIGVIKAYADYLEKAVPADDPMREDFHIIRSEAQRCEEIVRRMLDFASPRVEGFASLRLDALLGELVPFVFHEREEGRAAPAAELLVPEPPPPVAGDAVQLKQAFLNILVNARQVLVDSDTPAGRVVVTLGRGTGPRPPVRIAVRDNGPGIDEEAIERAFEPFFTRRREGTGLGLAITRRIIEAHSGSISLARHPDGGTVVTVELPIEGEEAP